MKIDTLPFDRPQPITAAQFASTSIGFHLSLDDGPTFLVPVRSRGEALIAPVFATESDGWKEAAYRAVEAGRDPAPYVERAQATS